MRTAGATATLLLACSAVAFQVSHPHVQGLTRASKLRGLCQTRMRAAGAEPMQSRRSAIAFLIVGLVGVPGSSFAAKKAASPDADEIVETISLDDFYAALEDQEVLKVEFDGPKFEKCFVFKLDGKMYLVGAGYPVESSVSSVGPQSVIGKIKNEIKSGNPVTWSWRGAGAFKKFSPKKQAEVDKAQGNLSAENAKREKEGAEEKKGGLFGLSFPVPPKSLQSSKSPAAEEDDGDE